MKTKKLLTWVAASTLLVGLVSCTKEQPQPEPEPEPVVTLTEINITSEPKLVYWVGEQFSSNGLEVEAKYSDNTTKEVENYTMDLEDGYEFAVEDAGQKRVTVTYQQKTAYFTVLVKEVTVTGITVAGQYKSVYRLGEQFDPTGLVVTAQLSNGDTAEVTDYKLTLPSMNSYGQKTARVSYQGFSATFGLEVRMDTWGEYLDEVIGEEYGIRFTTPYAALDEFIGDLIDINDVTITEGLDEYGDSFIEVQLNDLNPAISAYVAYALGINYGLGLAADVDFAVLDFNDDYIEYDEEDPTSIPTGYFYFRGVSEINVEGTYVEVFIDGIDGEVAEERGYEDELRMIFTFREATEAEEAEELLNLALFGDDSIAKLEEEQEIFVEGKSLADVSNYYLVNAEFVPGTYFMQEMAGYNEFIADFISGKDVAAYYADIWDLLYALGMVEEEEFDYATSPYEYGLNYIAAEFDPEIYTVESLTNMLATILEYDMGLVAAARPQFVELDEQTIGYGLFYTMDGAIEYFLQVGLQYDDEEDEYYLVAYLDYNYTEVAYVGLASLEIILPTGTADQRTYLFEALEPETFDTYTAWEEIYGDVAVSKQETYNYDAAFIQFNAYQIRPGYLAQNYVAINVFADEAWLPVDSLIGDLNDYYEYYGFTTKLIDFSPVAPAGWFAYTSDLSMFRIMTFDFANAYSAQYADNGLQEVLALAYLLSGEWDLSYYEPIGYVATSKESVALPGGVLPMKLQVTFYSYNYLLYFFVEMVPVELDYETMAPTAMNNELNSIMTELYGEESLTTITEFASLMTYLGEEEFELGTYTYPNGSVAVVIKSDSATDDAYDAIYYDFLDDMYMYSLNFEFEGYASDDYGTYGGQYEEHYYCEEYDITLIVWIAWDVEFDENDDYYYVNFVNIQILFGAPEQQLPDEPEAPAPVAVAHF